MNLLDAEAIIFDCDGVILQSNTLKSQAFASALPDYDRTLVEQFVDWHKANGGVSRYAKFEYFFRSMLQVADWEQQTSEACERFAALVSSQLLSCPFIPGYERLLDRLVEADIPSAVNTGGAEAEIRKVFEQRLLLPKFEAVLGSPTTKHDNMTKLLELGLVSNKSIYFGDSELDYELARKFEMAFVYVGFESEWKAGANLRDEPRCFVINDHQHLAENSFNLA